MKVRTVTARDSAHASLSRAIACSLAYALTGATAALLSTNAIAQQAPQRSGNDALADVVVTGSRIRGIEPVGAKVIGIDREAAIEVGAPTTSDLLRKVPQIVGLGASETASGAQNGAANVTRGVAVNLRGIGSNATLLLWNGRRMPPAGTQGQFTDASVIPSIALERLEVVADGGSAIYGSDAITGVVNIITRNTFDGAETSARYGTADSYWDWQIGQIVGTGWDGGHAMFAIEHNRHSALNGQDRDFYTSNLTSRGGSDFRANQCAPGNIVVGGVSYAIPATSTGTGLTPASFTANTRNLCDNLKRGDIIPELERTSAVLSLSQRLGETTEVFADAVWSRRKFVLGDSQIVSNLTVTNANPFYVNPTGGTGPITVQYDFAKDGGLPRNPGLAESWNAVVGVRQSFGHDWQGQLVASYGASKDEVNRTQNLNTTPGGINAALANTNPTLAFNPFGQGGISNAATVAAVRNGLFVIKGDTDLTTVVVNADGPLFAMSGGDLRVAVGAEYRKEGLGGSLRSGSAVAPVFVPSNVSRNMKAAFVEFYVPLFGAQNARAGAQRLDLTLAGRYEDYSDFGTTFNPKIGFSWAPLDALTVRGSWGTSFRAPGLAETDPRSSGYGLYGDTLPCSHRPPATTCFGIGIAGGNPNLEPEDATTWSVGFDLAPERLKGFRLSATYFDIDYQKQILGLRGTAGLLTNSIYSQYATLNPSAAQVSALLASGLPINSPINAALVTYIQDGRRQNLGSTVAKGFDADVSQSFTAGNGEFRLALGGTYFTTFDIAATATAPELPVLSTLNFPQRFRFRAEAGWRGNGGMSFIAFMNYTSQYQQTGVTPIRTIDAYHPVDLHFGWDFDKAGLTGFGKGFSLSLDLQNAFSDNPPFVNISGGYDPQSANPIGRTFAVSIRKSW